MNPTVSRVLIRTIHQKNIRVAAGNIGSERPLGAPPSVYEHLGLSPILAGRVRPAANPSPRKKPTQHHPGSAPDSDSPVGGEGSNPGFTHSFSSDL